MSEPGSSWQPGPWLSRRDGGAGYALSGAATGRLGWLLRQLEIAPSAARIVPGYTAHASAFVLGRLVVISRGRWPGMTETRQLGLLAHELVHVGQYARLGWAGIPRFLYRYMPEYHLRSDNYRPPLRLLHHPIEQVDVLDRRYTLDQLAERFRFEVCAEP